jgi:peptidoglycan/LPS O-acetylase OafA/YrhL
MPNNTSMRRLATLTLGLLALALFGFAVYYGLSGDSGDESQGTQLLYATMLLLPPAIFVALALGLLFRRAPSGNVLGLVAIAVLVGAPTLVFFFGAVVGAVVAATALIVIGTVLVHECRRTAVS